MRVIRHRFVEEDFPREEPRLTGVRIGFEYAFYGVKGLLGRVGIEVERLVDGTVASSTELVEEKVTTVVDGRHDEVDLVGGLVRHSEMGIKMGVGK